MWIKEQALELTRRKILAAAFNYSLVLDSRSVYFYVENPHLLLPHGCFCQLCASVTNKCTLNESLEQEFGDLIHFFHSFSSLSLYLLSIDSVLLTLLNAGITEVNRRADPCP